MRSDRNSRSTPLLACASALALALGAAGCGPDDPPENPTWADVEPILRAECTGCHGSSANATGGGYRFDFFDFDMAHPSPCGQAGDVLADISLARAQADKIAKAITTTDPNIRPMMPPLPAPYLSDEEWVTILRWTANPVKGDMPARDRAPRIIVDGTPTTANQRLDVNVLVEDPEGEPVVGILKVGDQVEKMDRSGAFSKSYDTSSWPPGTVTMSAVLCDGWSQVSVDLLEITIQH